MRFWKLGIYWGEGKESFLPFIEKEDIVLSNINRKHFYSIGDLVLICDGHDVLGIAEVLSDLKPITSNISYEEDCSTYNIHFEEWVNFAKAKLYLFSTDDQYKYPLQTGSCEVQQQEIKDKAQELFKKYQAKEEQDLLITLLKQKYQIILQGPPGTGKTYTAKEIAYEVLFNKPLSKEKEERKTQLEELNESEQFKLIQFHPSYSYEDFVRGIVVQSNDANQIEYITQNKVLGELASKALESCKETTTSVREWLMEQLNKYQEEVKTHIEKSADDSYGFDDNEKTVINGIDEDKFRYYWNKYKSWKAQYGPGFDLFYKDIIDIVIKHLEKIKNEESDFLLTDATLSSSAKHTRHKTSIIEDFIKSFNGKLHQLEYKKTPLKNYVLIIDEINRANLPSALGELIYALEYRGEPVESMYELDGDSKLVLPPNLYIIGTMNTADRSVGHIDYAIRRRFAFIDVLPNLDIINLPVAKNIFSKIDELFEQETASDFDKNDVMLGHSYFLAETEQELKLKLKYEVVPILKEYLKDGILNNTSEAKESLSEINTLIDGI